MTTRRQRLKNRARERCTSAIAACLQKQPLHAMCDDSEVLEAALEVLAGEEPPQIGLLAMPGSDGIFG